VILADLITYPQAIVLGLLQGVSELFPISSLGHSVILPSLLGWDIHQNDKYFLTFLVATHLATAIVLFFFFWRDWMRIFRGLGRSLRDREISADDPDAKLGWLLIVGTIPAGILGLTLQDSLRKIFASPTSAAIFLTLNGVLLYGAELLRRRAPVTETDDDARIARTVSWRGGFFVGAAQAIALIPGFSRSGATMAGGLLVGLSNEDAARFAFLLATPIIGAAAVLKLPELFGSTGDGVRGQALVAALCSAAAAYFAVRFLMRYFETNTLMPFAIYCFVAGLACTIYFVS
jgi:undecaprenyl-diphosphatase